MKRHKWSEIKARTRTETRIRIEDQSRDLSNELRLQRLTDGALPREASRKKREP